MIGFNSLRSHARTQSDIAHEVSHLLLGHDLDEVRMVAGTPFRTCRPDQEEEATNLDGTLLLPRPLLLRAARQGLGAEEIAEQYGARPPRVPRPLADRPAPHWRRPGPGGELGLRPGRLGRRRNPAQRYRLVADDPGGQQHRAAGLCVLGLGTLVYGLWPRLATTVGYGLVAWSFLVPLIGAIVTTNRFLLDTSVLPHVTPAPAANPNWTSAG